MHSSVVSFTCAAGALAMFLSCAGRAAVAADLDKLKSAAPDVGAVVAGGDARAEAASPPAPETLPREGLADASSYADAFRVLSYESSCSSFYGGPTLALTVLNGLASQLRRRPLGPEGAGIVMMGGYDVYRDGATGRGYRLFKEAYVNSDGPFISRVLRPHSPRLRVGRFEAETRQAKALLLLHELGHLVAAPAGDKWLLPDDGGDARQSERNTQTIESQCLKQLLALGA